MTAVQALTVAIYCRVSSAEQERRGTIEAQRMTLLAHAARAGYAVQGVYCDDGKSAATGKLDARDAFARLLVAAERGAFSSVLVVAIDRLTRTDDLIERASILGPLQRAGVTVVTPSGTIDLRTFTGDLMAGLESAMAALERRKIYERTQAGKERAIAAGGKPHGRTPYGLRYRRGEGWSAVPHEADVIREICRRVAGTESCVRIALDLEARGVPRPGKPWGQALVRSIVREARDRYAGRWVANKNRGVVLEVPRLLTDAEIDRAELALHDHQRRGLEHRTRGVYLLDRRHATCGRCGGWIGVRGHGRGDEAYTCRSRGELPAGAPGRCGAEIIPVGRVDGLLWAELVDLIASPSLVERTLRAFRDRGTDRDPAEAQRQLAAARQRVADADRRAAALAGRVDALPAELLTPALDRLAQERKDAAAALAEAERVASGAHLSEAATDDLEAEIEQVRIRAATADAAERRAIVRALVPRAVIADQRLVVRVALPGLVTTGSGTREDRARDGTLRIWLAA